MNTKSITLNQHRQIIRFLEDEMWALKLDKDGAQRLIERGGNMQDRFREAVLDLSSTKHYAGEESKSEWTYPPGYKVKEIAKQVGILRETFPSLGRVNEIVTARTLPNGAEGWFAIPRWNRIADTYNEAILKTLAAIKVRHNNNSGNLCDLKVINLHQHEHAVLKFQQIQEAQATEILLVPAQFGIRHRGRSIRRAREVMKDGEFGLGLFAVGIMLLTHPERLASFNSLWIGCAGDEYIPLAEQRSGYAAIICYRDSKIQLHEEWCGTAHPLSGAASAWGLA